MATTQRYRRRDRSLRLTFRFEGRTISLVDRREVDAAAPPSQAVKGREGKEGSGFWVELKGADGRTLYRRVMRNPIRASVEIALEEGGFTNRVSVAERGAFSLVVPNLPDAVHVSLYSSPIERPHIPEPATEIVRVSIREEPREPKEPPREPPKEPDRPEQGPKEPDRPKQRDEPKGKAGRTGDEDRPDQRGPKQG